MEAHQRQVEEKICTKAVLWNVLIIITYSCPNADNTTVIKVD